MTGFALTGSEVGQLEALRNRSRVLLVFTPSSTDEASATQKRLLEAAKAGLSERDLRVFYLPADEAGGSAQALRNHFGVSENAFVAVLIGKDGGEKARYLKPVYPQALFGLIDRMPMRRREMEQGKS
jgi:hypothetical protein